MGNSQRFDTIFFSMIGYREFRNATEVAFFPFGGGWLAGSEHSLFCSLPPPPRVNRFMKCSANSLAVLTLVNSVGRFVFGENDLTREGDAELGWVHGIGTMQEKEFWVTIGCSKEWNIVGFFGLRFKKKVGGSEESSWLLG